MSIFNKSSTTSNKEEIVNEEIQEKTIESSFPHFQEETVEPPPKEPTTEIISTNLQEEIKPTSEKQKSKKKKKRFQDLSEVEQEIIIALYRNPIQTPETVIKNISQKNDEPSSLTSFKRKLSQLAKYGYLKYTSSSKYQFVRATEKGRKAVLSSFYSWSTQSTSQEIFTFKDNSESYYNAALCAKLDTALVQQTREDSPYYGGYYAGCHFYGENNEQVCQIKLQDNTLITPDAIMTFQLEEIAVMGGVFFLKSLPVSFLYSQVDRQMECLLSKLSNSNYSDETKKKFESIPGLGTETFKILIIALEKGRRDEFMRSLNNSNSQQLKNIYISHIDELINSPGFWGESWFVPNSPNSAVRLQEVWGKS